jgi:hypothetical protein
MQKGYCKGASMRVDDIFLKLTAQLDANGNAMEVRSEDLRDLPCLKRGWTFAKCVFMLMKRKS